MIRSATSKKVKGFVWVWRGITDDRVPVLVDACMERRFEYYSAFSLMVTLVWMWTSVLRLLSLLSGRDD